jgi:hypothetical protein
MIEWKGGVVASSGQTSWREAVMYTLHDMDGVTSGDSRICVSTNVPGNDVAQAVSCFSSLHRLVSHMFRLSISIYIRCYLWVVFRC